MGSFRPVLKASLFCMICALILTVLSYVSPFWIQSWPRVYSPFKRLGLWEVCFSGYVHPLDYHQKAYHGCWWILAKEYFYIRDFLMPPWFIAVQIMVTATLLCQIAGIIFLILYFLSIRDNAQLVTFSLTASTGLMFFSALFMTTSVIVFGTLATGDRTWMPRPDLNYLSWSFGLAVVSGFFAIFATGALMIYYSWAKAEQKRVPQDPRDLRMVPKA